MSSSSTSNVVDASEHNTIKARAKNTPEETEIYLLKLTNTELDELDVLTLVQIPLAPSIFHDVREHVLWSAKRMCP